MQRELLSGLRSRLLRYLANSMRKSDRLLSEYVEKLKHVVPNSVILLFGSRARGKELPYSDYDVAVVLENLNNRIEVIERLRRLKPRGLNLDLVVLSVDELHDSIIKEMLKDAIILYEGIKIRDHHPSDSLGFT